MSEKALLNAFTCERKPLVEQVLAKPNLCKHIFGTEDRHEAEKIYQSRIKELSKERSIFDAALKIQAGFKGHQARKQVQEMKQEKKVENTAKEEEVDIDLNDPEVGDAALKIQAGFKGHQARKQVQEMKEKSDVSEKPLKVME